jgi:hypothetical protein
MSKVDESCVHSWSLVPLAEVFCVQAGVEKAVKSTARRLLVIVGWPKEAR